MKSLNLRENLTFWSLINIIQIILFILRASPFRSLSTPPTAMPRKPFGRLPYAQEDSSKGKLEHLLSGRSILVIRCLWDEEQVHWKNGCSYRKTCYNDRRCTVEKAIRLFVINDSSSKSFRRCTVFLRKYILHFRGLFRWLLFN